MSDSRRTTLALAFAAMLLSPPLAHAQPAFPPASFTNLQVLPPTTTPADLMAIMKSAAQGLGVRCQYCHIGEEGQPLAQFDFVSDQKPKKQMARAMLRLVETINSALARDVGPEAAARVTCFTCHRGAPRPAHAPDAAHQP